MTTVRLAALLLSATASVAAPSSSAHAQAAAAAGAAIDTLALRAHTRFLADDALAGRAAGSAGERLAASYIAAQLARIGVEPAAPGRSFLQPVPLMAAEILPATRLIVQRGGDTASFAHGTGFVINAGGRDAIRDFDGPVLLLPDPLPDPLPDSLDLRGRVIVPLGGLGVDAGRHLRDWQRRGAAAVVLPTDDAERLALIHASRGPERLYLDLPVDEPVWQPAIPILIAGPAATAVILAGVTPADAMAPTQLPDRIGLSLHTRRRALKAANVAGLVTGSDPARRDELVVYTAHYDHLGIGPPVDGDSIYNGFSDNAAGVAMLLGIADAMRADPPARSVLFLFFSAEERGLLGSTYYATEPLRPLDDIAAVINLDAGAPPAPPTTWRIAGSPESRLAAIADSLARDNGWGADLGPASANSDHWAFLSRGIPSIFIIPGNVWEGLDDAGRDALRTRWDRYHLPDDEYAPDFPFAGVARYATFALDVGRAAANAPR